MSNQPDVQVKLDDRIRLMSAVLAATDYPDKAQQRKPHGTHAHARSMRKFVSDHTSHPAVKETQGLLDQGTPIEALFTLIMLLKWPELEIAELPRWVPSGYNQHLRDFYTATGLEDWLKTNTEKELWDKALSETQKIFAETSFKSFLEKFVGKIEENFYFVPNISYPTNYDVGVRIGSDLYCIAPPPPAWGESPPWPYDDPTMTSHSYQAALTVYGRILLLTYLRSNQEKLAAITENELPVSDEFKARHPSWEDQFAELFCMAAVAMYFETHVSNMDYKAYVLMQKKAHGMALLPGTVSVMRRYLKEVGDRYEDFLDFLPNFSKHLRVAQKIVTL
jgi:hypothetical protein